MMHFNRNIDDKPSVFVEKIENIPGSTSGAGSGEYYTYKNRRRDELAKENQMKSLVYEENRQKQFDEGKKIENSRLDRIRNKRKMKRMKKKLAKKEAKKAKHLNSFADDGSFLERFKQGTLKKVENQSQTTLLEKRAEPEEVDLPKPIEDQIQIESQPKKIEEAPKEITTETKTTLDWSTLATDQVEKQLKI